MAVTTTPVFPQSIVNSLSALVNSTGAFTFTASSSTTTNLVSALAGGTNGSIVEAINVTTTDTSANILWFILNNGTTNMITTVVNIPAGSGVTSGTTPPIDVLRSTQSPALPYDVNGNKILYVPSGCTLFVGTTSAVTSGKQVSVQILGVNL